MVNNNDENSSNEQNQLEKQLEKIEKQEKKQKKKKKKSKPKSIGRTIKQGDKSYELMFAMLLGIRTSLSNLSSKKLPNNKFTSKEYKEVENYFFPRLEKYFKKICFETAFLIFHSKFWNSQYTSSHGKRFQIQGLCTPCIPRSS